MLRQVTRSIKWKIESEGLVLRSSGREGKFPNFWLIDHDKSQSAFNHKTLQRDVQTFKKFDERHKIKNVSINMEKLLVEWDAGFKSEFQIEYLESFLTTPDFSRTFPDTHELWEGKKFPDVEHADYQAKIEKMIIKR